MLNYCIERKKAREMQLYEKKTSGSEDNSSEEEFFECNDPDVDKRSVDEFYSCNQESAKLRDSLTESDNYSAEGRLRQCGNLKLIQNNETLYIPVTQVII